MRLKSIMKKIVLFLLLFFPIVGISQVTIQMQEDGGVYKVPCEVNGLRMKFIFDTGASNVCISMTEAKFMYENDYISSDDILGSSKSQIADGSIVENTRIRLKEIKIAGLTLRDVEAVVTHSFGAPLLLGQSAIQRLGTIQINGNELTIIEHSKEKSKEEIDKMFEEADYFYSKHSYSVAAKKYQELYDLGELSDYGIFILASCYKSTQKYKQATSYYNKIKDFTYVDKRLYHWALGRCYEELDDFDNALYHYELQSEYEEDKTVSFGGLYNIAMLYRFNDELYKAQKCFEELLELYKKQKNIVLNDDFAKQLKSGKFKDELFAEYLFNIYYLEFKRTNSKESLNVLRGMARYGNKFAIEYLDYIGVEYKPESIW